MKQRFTIPSVFLVLIVREGILNTFSSSEINDSSPHINRASDFDQLSIFPSQFSQDLLLLPPTLTQTCEPYLVLTYNEDNAKMPSNTYKNKTQPGAVPEESKPGKTEKEIFFCRMCMKTSDSREERDDHWRSEHMESYNRYLSQRENKTDQDETKLETMSLAILF